jgi:hypothetical protein
LSLHPVIQRQRHHSLVIRFERPEALDELNRPDRIRAQHECWRERRCTMHDLWHFADVCRVRNVMRPYMESLAV